MAKGDIVAKLVLNSKDFDGKLAKSKKEISSMQGMGSKVFGGMTTALKGFAVAAGAAVTVSEAFKAVIGSSQGLTDAWGRSLEATKTVFDNFVYSVANADFSSFENGLANMISQAREAYDALDQLANTKMSATFVTTLDQSRYREAMSRARNKSLSKEERQAALDEAKSYAATISEAAQKVSIDSEAALRKQFAAKLGVDASAINAAMIEDAFRVDARFTSDEERKRIKGDVADYRRLLKDAEYAEKRVVSNYGGKVKVEKEADFAKAAQIRQEATQKYMPALVKQLALERLKDEELNEAMQLFLSATQSRNAAAEIYTSTNELQASLNTPVKGVGGAVAAQKRRAFALGKMQGYNPAMPSQTPSAGELPATITSPFENEKIAGWADAVFFEEEIKAMDEAGKKAETLTGAFATLGSAIGGSAGQMLNFAGSLTDAVAAITPFLAYLQAEAVQHDVNATAAMKEAAAKTLAAYSGIPFAGIALGAAAVASLVGVMKSLPMLAEGGVVTGPTVAMIGEAGKEAVIPLDKLNDFIDVAPREVRVTGEIHGAGKELVVVIDNYNKARRVK